MGLALYRCRNCHQPFLFPLYQGTSSVASITPMSVDASGGSFVATNSGQSMTVTISLRCPYCFVDLIQTPPSEEKS